jgi:hypothetical protein
MNPRSGLSVRDDLGFLGSIAIDAESVRALMIVSLELSVPGRVSLQPPETNPASVAQPERRSVAGPPPAERATHLPERATVFPAHSTSFRAAGRCETEYMSAARDETATASSKTAINSSPITNPRRSPRPDVGSAGTSTPPSCRPTCCGGSPEHRTRSWLSRPRRSCSCIAWYRSRSKWERTYRASRSGR